MMANAAGVVKLIWFQFYISTIIIFGAIIDALAYYISILHKYDYNSIISSAYLISATISILHKYDYNLIGNSKQYWVIYFNST